MAVVALVLAAGQGVRLAGGEPKGFVRIDGRTLLDWSSTALARARGVDAVLPVIPASKGEAADELGRTWQGPARLLEPVVGGPTRQASLRCGLDAAERQLPEVAWVLVHDAARPFVEPADAEAVLAAAQATGAALPVIPVGDTLKELEGDQVIRTLDRSRLGFAQTPQAFRLALLREALEKAEREGFTGTDDAVLVERLGGVVRTCPGRVENFKLTYPADLARAEALLRARGAGR